MSGAPRIRLIVTGNLERKAMATSLMRYFPVAEWLRPHKAHCATSSRLRPLGNPERAIAKLAAVMIQEVHGGVDKGVLPADLILVVDDLELHNQDQPALVCEHFRAAVDVEIGALGLSQPAEQRLRTKVHNRCAFHFMAPMVEAYFFGDSAALERAGCGSDTVPQLVGDDMERFESNDSDWLPWCQEENVRKAELKTPQGWWREERHPKHYLDFLIGQNDDGDYTETTDGVAAFSSLDWPKVPADGDATPLARALFEDIADFFGVGNPLPGTPSPLTYPLRAVNRSTLLLRNM